MGSPIQHKILPNLFTFIYEAVKRVLAGACCQIWSCPNSHCASMQNCVYESRHVFTQPRFDIRSPLKTMWISIEHMSSVSELIQSQNFFLSICSSYFTLNTQGQHLGDTDFVTWTVRLSVVGCCNTVSADKYYNGKGFCGHYLAYPIIKKYCCASCCYLFSARSLTHSLTHACI